MDITSQQIAEYAGVSRGTVDRALHNREGVNADVAEKILTIARKYGYRPNAIGRALSTGRTYTVGVVLFDFEHSFFSEMFAAFENRARDDRYLPLAALSHTDPETEREAVGRLTERGIDGLLIMSVRKDRNYITYIESLDIPVVTFANRLSRRIPHIWIDEEKAGMSAARYIAQRNYTRLVYYAPPLDRPGDANIEAQLERAEGVRREADRLGLEYTLITDKTEIQDVIICSSEPNCALLCCTDEYALFCLNEMREAGLQPGRDMGIMGFDNLAFLKFVSPRPATVGFSKDALGCRAFEMIFDMIEGGRVHDRIMNHWILKGETL